MAKKVLYEFITGLVTIVFGFFAKLRCACCNSTCIVDKSLDITLKEENNVLKKKKTVRFND